LAIGNGNAPKRKASGDKHPALCVLALRGPVLHGGHRRSTPSGLAVFCACTSFATCWLLGVLKEAILPSSLGFRALPAAVACAGASGAHGSSSSHPPPAPPAAPKFKFLQVQAQSTATRASQYIRKLHHTTRQRGVSARVLLRLAALSSWSLPCSPPACYVSPPPPLVPLLRSTPARIPTSASTVAVPPCNRATATGTCEVSALLVDLMFFKAGRVLMAWASTGRGLLAWTALGKRAGQSLLLPRYNSGAAERRAKWPSPFGFTGGPPGEPRRVRRFSRGRCGGLGLGLGGGGGHQERARAIRTAADQSPP
jgi:hypothetical protein